VRRTLALLLMLAPVPGMADSAMPAAALADTQLADPKQEAEAAALMETLRCVVCQGQSIADSDAEIAGDMRAMVRERIQRGETPDQIRGWMIERYGEWISYDPPLSGRTALLWIAPVLLLGAGIWLARGRFRRRVR
jgi:cytochrome c-type biogenesis protein CcmH